VGDGTYVKIFDDQVTSLAIVAEIVAVMVRHLKPAFLADGLESVLKSSHILAVTQRMLATSMPC